MPRTYLRESILLSLAERNFQSLPDGIVGGRKLKRYLMRWEECRLVDRSPEDEEVMIRAVVCVCLANIHNFSFAPCCPDRGLGSRSEWHQDLIITSSNAAAIRSCYSLVRAATVKLTLSRSPAWCTSISVLLRITICRSDVGQLQGTRANTSDRSAKSSGEPAVNDLIAVGQDHEYGQAMGDLVWRPTAPAWKVRIGSSL